MDGQRVVNLREFRRPDTKFPLYDIPEDVVRIDRRSVYGNPFKIGNPDPNGYPLDREQVILLYRRYIEAKLRGDPDFLEPLRGKRLGCWCYPEACHGEVILEMLGETPEAGSS